MVVGEIPARGVPLVVLETSSQRVTSLESHWARTKEDLLGGDFEVPMVEATQPEAPVRTTTKAMRGQFARGPQESILSISSEKATMDHGEQGTSRVGERHMSS